MKHKYDFKIPIKNCGMTKPVFRTQ